MPGTDVLAGITDTSAYTGTSSVGSGVTWVTNGEDADLPPQRYPGIAGIADGIGIYMKDSGEATASNISLIVTDNAGVQLGRATSPLAGHVVDDWFDIDLDGADISVADGQEFILWYGIESLYTALFTKAAPSFATFNDASGSYAVPPAPFTVNTNSDFSTDQFAMRLLGTFGGAPAPSIDDVNTDDIVLDASVGNEINGSNLQNMNAVFLIDEKGNEIEATNLRLPP